MVNTKSLLSIVIYTSLSTAIPLTPQRGTQWQENEKSRSPSTQVVVPVPEVAPIKITIPISRIELSRISHPRAQSIVIVPSSTSPSPNSQLPSQTHTNISQTFKTKTPCHPPNHPQKSNNNNQTPSLNQHP